MLPFSAAAPKTLQRRREGMRNTRPSRSRADQPSVALGAAPRSTASISAFEAHRQVRARTPLHNARTCSAPALARPSLPRDYSASGCHAGDGQPASHKARSSQRTVESTGPSKCSPRQRIQAGIRFAPRYPSRLTRTENPVFNAPNCFARGGRNAADACSVYLQPIISESRTVISDYRHKFSIVGVYTASHRRCRHTSPASPATPS